MSTLSTRKIKHDSSSVDNITLQSNGNVGVNGGSVTTVSSGLAINNPTANSYPGLEIQTAGVTRLFLNANNAESYVSATGTNPLALYTNGTRQLTIDASGRVTTPNRPAFQVNHSLGNIGVGTVLFNNAVINTGSCYSTSTGRFTAPCNGLYYFSTVLGILSPTGNSCYIRKNGTQRLGLEIGGNSSGWWNLTGSIIIDLSTNDYVDVYFNNATSTYATFDQGIWTNFSGFLIG